MERGVGIRVFRDRLTRYVARVRRGDRVVVTDRGRPVAILVPYEAEDEPAPQRARLDRVLSGGHVAASERRLDVRFVPIRGKGEPPSRTIIGDRR
jgi:prevent-host-death family protein